MQKLRSVLKIGSSGAVLCDNYGSGTAANLELMYGTAYILEFELRSEASGESARLPDYPAEELNASAYYCAFDFSCSNSDTPPLLIFSGVSVDKDDTGKTVFSVPLDTTAVSGIAAGLKNHSTVELFCELGGIDADGNAVFAWQFPVTLRSRVYSGTYSNDTEIADPAYFTAIQIQAITGALDNRITAVENDLSEFNRELDGINSALEGI